VVVVDNASGDGSADALARAVRDRGWGAWAEVLPLAHNGGFAAGNNVALRPILTGPRPPAYLWLLNPDTVIRPGAGRALAAFLDRHPRAGLAGSRLEDPDGTPQRSAFRFPGVASEWEAGVRLGAVSRLLSRRLVAPPVRAQAHEADWLSGASLMVRRQVFEQVGLFDEGFFLYYEELDLCRRARRAGWRCWYVPDSRVIHLVSRSTGLPDHKAPPARPMPAYWFASRRRYFAKQGRPLDALCADIAWAVGFASWRLRRRVQRKPDPDPPGLLGDFVRYNFLRNWVGRDARRGV
jgi:GT2 family glycosyltransferase